LKTSFNTFRRRVRGLRKENYLRKVNLRQGVGEQKPYLK
jgi:hypothetical protein